MPATPHDAIVARQLTPRADWGAIAEWCGGRVEVIADARFISIEIGLVSEGSWIVATPGGQYKHAAYTDRDFKGFIALLRAGDQGVPICVDMA